ncbi:DUF5615 family PIN-like protein [Candidatus Palauibacter sp.]|uniref:DUF5615 family PIN-like protein n=1 Tax=Candidatus Palauibacter sp. TaxID=3101350 RepID=UPI003AF216C7
MKLLFDENISPRLVAALSDVFPGSVHVRDVGLARATDAAIWAYARDRGLTILSKDSDFHQVSFLRGPPPKVIWIRRGNCSTVDIEALLRSNRTEILAFGADEEAAFLALS